MPSAPDARSSRQAAQVLRDYANAAFQRGDADALGTKAHPSEVVRAAQRDMKLLTADGVYGPKTAARGKELLGIEFPNRARMKAPAAAPKAPPAPAPRPITELAPPVPPATAVAHHSPLEAANALLMLLQSSTQATWGTKASPNALIQQAQHDMGGLTADGIYGAKTQARGRTLTGKSFPTRK